MVLRKLNQSLFSRYRFYKNGNFLSKGIIRKVNTRKIVPLNVIVENNADLWNNMMKEKISNAEWQSIRERCLQIKEIIPSIVDSTIIDICLKYHQMDNAIAYFKFLRENNYSLNVAVIGRYLRLYTIKDNLNDKDKIEIVETYNDLRKKYPLLDAVTSEHCITSLCLTDQWEKTSEILEMLKITTLPGSTVYSTIAAAAFQNRKPDIAWKVLPELISRNLLPKNIVYTSYLSYCELEEKEIFDENMIKMFDFWAKYIIIPYNKIINAYVDAAGKHGWFSKATSISKTGICRHCGQSLSKITISTDTFQKLFESVMNEVIIGSDIYCKTNPEELNIFKKFVEKSKPYDIVIDGLNLTYVHKTSSDTLLEVIKHFSKQNKKILILTRIHQSKWPIFRTIRNKYKNVLVFYTQNLSADDPYLLYATMVSGENAMFVSLDLMRQHKHILKNVNLHREFQMWQCSHQYFVRKNKQNFYLQEPFVYLPTAQRNGDNWHVPYVDNFVTTNSEEFPDKWYCLRQQIK